jgi:hypothetical protein
MRASGPAAPVPSVSDYFGGGRAPLLMRNIRNSYFEPDRLLKPCGCQLGTSSLTCFYSCLAPVSWPVSEWVRMPAALPVAFEFASMAKAEPMPLTATPLLSTSSENWIGTSPAHGEPRQEYLVAVIEQVSRFAG